MLPWDFVIFPPQNWCSEREQGSTAMNSKKIGSNWFQIIFQTKFLTEFFIVNVTFCVFISCIILSHRLLGKYHNSRQTVKLKLCISNRYYITFHIIFYIEFYSATILLFTLISVFQISRCVLYSSSYFMLYFAFHFIWKTFYCTLMQSSVVFHIEFQVEFYIVNFIPHFLFHSLI